MHACSHNEKCNQARIRFLCARWLTTTKAGKDGRPAGCGSNDVENTITCQQACYRAFHGAVLRAWGPDAEPIDTLALDSSFLPPFGDLDLASAVSGLRKAVDTELVQKVKDKAIAYNQINAFLKGAGVMPALVSKLTDYVEFSKAWDAQLLQCQNHLAH